MVSDVPLGMKMKMKMIMRSLPFCQLFHLHFADAGSKYMVVDCGGGTVDITVHQLEDLTKETLKELHKVII